MVISCVVQILYSWEAFAVWISGICKKLTGFFTVFLIILLGNAVVRAAYCTEIITSRTSCIVYTVRNISVSRNLTSLRNVLYDVVTVDYK